MNHVLDKLTILLVTLLLRGLLGILLQSPDSPKRNVRHLDFCDMNRKRLALHKLIVTTHGSLHHQLKVVVLLDRESKTRQRDECITGTALEPRIARQDVSVVVLFTTMELMRRIHQTMEEIITWRTLIYFFFKEFLQATGLDFRSRGSKDDSLTLLDTHLEISWHIEVFIRSITSFLLLRIFYAAIPIRAEFKLVLLRELHIEVWIASIHASLDSVIYTRIVTRCC